MAKRKNSPLNVVKPIELNISSANSIIGKKVRLKCKNFKQKEYASLIKNKEITICSGPAGVGKSYVAIAIAIELIQTTSNSYNKILIVKPAIEVEENLGFLPGDLKEKMAPYMAASLDIVDKIVGKEKRKKLEESEDLMIEPLGFIRGKTIDNSILIMEEAQNMSPAQMKTLLTRIGYNSKYIISGDLDQSDKYDSIKKTGLFDAIQKHKNIKEIGIFEFNENDIVRNPLITKILNNYKK
jgi:phosphate starvation-inducible PhoH-like protein